MPHRIPGLAAAHVRWWRRNAHTALVFGGFLIAMAWLLVFTHIARKESELHNDALADLGNFTLLFKEDALRTVQELDRLILYVRRSYERESTTVDWPALIGERFTVSSRTVQIAILDASGMMITSTAMPHPKQPVDLSDREHFRVHVNTFRDDLFISKPVIGRASGQWSIQFTRRFTKPDGTFGGVIVVSLNPTLFVETYGKIQALPNPIFELVGNDNIVRASAGGIAARLGQSYSAPEHPITVPMRTPSINGWSEQQDGRTRLAASLPVGSYPLTVIASIDSPIGNAAVIAEQHRYYLAATLFSVVVLLVSVISVLRERRHVRHITGLAHKDALTGLANRLAFRSALDAVYGGRRGPAGVASERRATEAALHLIDLDRFKFVNDTYGHPVGDALLVAVADRLRAAVRRGDTIYRLGGDEFALLMIDADTHEQAGQLAARVCRTLAEPFLIDGHRLEIGASVGVAMTAADGDCATGVMQAADMALYLAKADGRGTHRFYNASMNAELNERRQLEIELASAAERGELRLHYQPKVGVGGVCGYEALIRWQHPVRGLLGPHHFIALAEETGSIVPMGAWILREACALASTLPAEQTVAVNVSAIQFNRSDVVETVAAALAETGLPSHRLEIEITESALMRGDKAVLTQLQRLREMGVAIALDDFGTGYSSLSYLHTYPIDYIKIDRSFVTTIGTENGASPIIRAIVTMARELRMVTVAEGVETAEQVEALIGYGCTVFQGYYFGKPRPAAELWDRSTIAAFPQHSNDPSSATGQQRSDAPITLSEAA